MQELVTRYLPKTNFTSYEDFKENYRVTVPDSFNFAYDVVDEWARMEPDKLALWWVNDFGEEKKFTFGEMKTLSDKAANLFRKRGIGKGDPVMLILKQRPEAWICMVALHKLGAICISAVFQLTAKDIAYRCNAAGVKMVVAVGEDEILTQVDAAKPDCPTVHTYAQVGGGSHGGFMDFQETLAATSGNFTRPTGDEAARPGDPMLIYFSSGTTGLPKMVWHDFTYPLGHIVTAKYWQQVENNGLHLTMSDSGWAKFGWGKIYGQWICGTAVVAYDTEKFTGLKVLETMQRLKLTTFCAPPTVYRFLIKEDLSAYDLSTITHCGIAGEPLNPEVYYQFLKATGMALTEGFGQSETTVLIANYPWFPVKPGSMGKPSPLYDVDLVDESGNPCEDGAEGAIVVRNTHKRHPTGLFRGYFKDDAQTLRCWKNGTYNTGDMAWRDADGYYWFVGRNDDVIKCSGYRIGPFEVESTLLEHPSVLECAVTAAPDPLRGAVVKATVVLAKGYDPSPELVKTLQNHVKKATAPYKYPRIVEFVSELPKTFSGKIRRAQLRQEDSQ